MQGNITDWGKEVKKGLIERGWSINDLAERIGKSRTRVSGVVNGRIYSDSIASAISDLLNIEKASASMKEATRDWCMDARKAMIDLDMNTGELAEKYKLNAKDVYVRTLDMSQAMAENARLIKFEEQMEADRK